MHFTEHEFIYDIWKSDVLVKFSLRHCLFKHPTILEKTPCLIKNNSRL